MSDSEYSDSGLGSDSGSGSGSDSGSIGRRRHRGRQSRSGRVRSRKLVVLAKIFMSTPDPIPDFLNNRKIEPWDGEDPGNTKILFVYAYIHKDTYESYVFLRSGQTTPEYNTLMHGTPMHVPYSSIHNPYLKQPGLQRLLKNLMSGTLSFKNSRDPRDQHRIYEFAPPITTGIEHFGICPPPTKPTSTYWYRLNNLHGGDEITEGLPGLETIRYDIPEDEFKLLYTVVSGFKITNHTIFLCNREAGQLPRKLSGTPERLLSPEKTDYRPLHDPNRGPGSKVPGLSRGLSHGPRISRISRHGGKKNSKKRNKTRRKYRKIKSRRRRVVR